MLSQRIITAVVLAILFASALFAPRAEYFYGFGFLILLIGTWEWSKLSGLNGFLSRAAYSLLLAVVFVLSASEYHKLVQGVAAFDVLYVGFCMAAFYWLYMTVLVFRYPHVNRFFYHRLARLVYGLILLTSSWLSILYLRGHSQGLFWVVYVVAIVAAADIGAYFMGRRFGRKKLAVEVSPGKSWEGFFGGLLLAQIVAIGFYWQLPQNSGVSSLGLFLFAALVLSAVSVLGDLSESMIKRVANCKDSGTILPGHGGVLDRVDGLTAALPVLALFVLVFAW